MGISFIDSETVQYDEYDTDRYSLESKNVFSTKEISIYVDFKNNEIRGDIIAYGEWLDLTNEECIDYLNELSENQILRDFSDILKKYDIQEVRQEIQAIVGDPELMEKSYLISEALKDSKNNVLVYADNVESALDMYVTYGEENLHWNEENVDLSNIENENIFLAKGYYPLDLDCISVQELEVDAAKTIETDFLKETNKRKNDLEF